MIGFIVGVTNDTEMKRNLFLNSERFNIIYGQTDTSRTECSFIYRFLVSKT